MKNSKQRMPKADYFRMRYASALDAGLTSKADYYKSRLEQMGEPLQVEEAVDSTPSYDSAVRKCVNVLNAPKGTVNQKLDFVLTKLYEEGFTEEEASTIWLEALNIASNGALLSNI